MADLKNCKLVFKLQDLHPEVHQPKVKKNIVIGDSIIKNVNGGDVSLGDSVMLL